VTYSALHLLATVTNIQVLKCSSRTINVLLFAIPPSCLIVRNRRDGRIIVFAENLGAMKEGSRLTISVLLEHVLDIGLVAVAFSKDDTLRRGALSLHVARDTSQLVVSSR
jgi:hypothetical protein